MSGREYVELNLFVESAFKNFLKHIEMINYFWNPLTYIMIINSSMTRIAFIII
jgi:hypothetical protein